MFERVWLLEYLNIHLAPFNEAAALWPEFKGGETDVAKRERDEISAASLKLKTAPKLAVISIRD